MNEPWKWFAFTEASKAVALFIGLVAIIVVLGGIVEMSKSNAADEGGNTMLSLAAKVELMEGCVAEAARICKAYNLGHEAQMAMALALYESLEWR